MPLNVIRHQKSPAESNASTMLESLVTAGIVLFYLMAIADMLTPSPRK